MKICIKLYEMWNGKKKYIYCKELMNDKIKREDGVHVNSK